MRMVDPDQVHFAVARFAVGAQQIFGTQLIARGLRAGRRVFERDGVDDGLFVTIDRADHRAAAFVRISGLRVVHHFAPGLAFNRNHQSFSSQKCSLRYLSAPSQRMVTITPRLPASCSSFAIWSAACTLPPAEMPTSRPSSRAMRRTIL